MNFPTSITKELTFTTKKLEIDFRGRKKSVRSREACYELTYTGRVAVIKTMQGFWKKALLWAMTHRVNAEFIDLRTKDLIPPPKLGLTRGFRFKQRELLATALEYNCSGLIGAPTRYGKCHGANTEILMHDGSVKMIQDISPGDIVMGHDSKPRRVSSIVQGDDVMYRITPNKGESFEVTQDHNLVLWRTSSGVRKTPRKTKGGMTRSPNFDHKEIIITPAELESKSCHFKHLHKLISRPVEFESKATRVDPYCYGLWIGDGSTKNPALTSADKECVDAWLHEAKLLGIKVRVVEKIDNKANTYCYSNSLKPYAWFDVVRESNKTGIKSVLPEFKINSREVRLSVLAGIIDSDGYINNEKAYAVVGKHLSLMKDVQFIARSLGYRATIHTKSRTCQTGHTGIYYEVHISGRVDEIPVRLERKKLTGLKDRINFLATGFKCENIGTGKYYGFELEEEDKKYLMGNFMVTHNSTILLNLLRAWPDVQTIVTLPGADLLRQCYDELQKALPDREIKMIGAGSKVKFQSEDVTVVSMDSLHKVDPGPVRLVIIDEPHAMAATSRIDFLPSFSYARKYGLGATLSGRFDGRDFLLEGLIGPILANRTYKEAVEEGAICPIKVMMIRWPLPYLSGDRDAVYSAALYENELVGRCARYLSDVVIPKEWQMLYFIKTEAQADFLCDCIGRDVAVAMAKKLTSKERAEMTDQIRKNRIKRVICSDIYVQGVTFHEVMVLVNCGGGGASTTTIQKPGRLAEIRPGKSGGLLIDFMFVPPRTGGPAADTVGRDLPPGVSEGMGFMIRESMTRMQAYRDIGYDVHVVEMNGIQEWFEKQNITAPT